MPKKSRPMADNPHVIVLSGEYDVYNAPTALADALKPAYEERDVILDFSGVRYIDSSGINQLVRKRRYRSELGYPPSPFVGLSPAIERLFSTVGLDKIWPFCATVDEAVNALKRSSQ